LFADCILVLQSKKHAHLPGWVCKHGHNTQRFLAGDVYPIMFSLAYGLL